MPDEPQTSELPELDPNAKIVIGDDKEATLGEMAKAYEENAGLKQQMEQLQQQTQAVTQQTETPEAQQQKQAFEVWQKAMKGDPQATQQVWQQYAPQPEKELSPAEQEIQTLKKELEGMKNQFSETKQITDGIRSLSEWNNVKSTVEKYSPKYPLAGKDPRAASVFYNMLQQYEVSYRSQPGMQDRSINQLPLDQREKIVDQCMNATQQELAKSFEAFGIDPQEMIKKMQSETNGQGTKVEAVDDQTKDARTGDERTQDAYRRARYGVDTEGNLIDRATGKAILGPQGTNIPQQIPSDPVQPPNTGRPVAPDGNVEQPKGPMTLKSLMENMRGQLESL